MEKVVWKRNWSEASVTDLAAAVAELATVLDGYYEVIMLEQAAEELWRLADLEK
jgi:hypothetical protein